MSIIEAEDDDGEIWVRGCSQKKGVPSGERLAETAGAEGSRGDHNRENALQTH